MRLALLLALAIALPGCPAGDIGTIELGLTSAPGSPLLDAVTRLRVTLTSPRQVVEADRTERGFVLELDVDATGGFGSLIVEGFDVTGGLIAAGQSPPFAIAALDARIVVYLAAPFTVGAAPPSYLMDGREAISNLTAAPLAYGALLVGGRALDGSPSSGVHVYNAYDHGVTAGRELPAPREGAVVASGARGLVFVFGGLGVDGAPTGTSWVFDTTVSPAGAYTELATLPEHARTDELAVQLGPDVFVITGAPPLDLRGGAITARDDATDLAPVGASLVLANTPVALLAARNGRFLLLRGNALTALELAPRTGAAIVALPAGRFAIVGGTTAGAPVRAIEIVDAATGMATRFPDTLSIARQAPALAVTSRHVVVAGGTTMPGDVPVDFIEILDAATLAPLATATHRLPATGSAIALPNDQVLFIGSSLELSLFTPPPPALP